MCSSERMKYTRNPSPSRDPNHFYFRLYKCVPWHWQVLPPPPSRIISGSMRILNCSNWSITLCGRARGRIHRHCQSWCCSLSFGEQQNPRTIRSFPIRLRGNCVYLTFAFTLGFCFIRFVAAVAAATVILHSNNFVSSYSSRWTWS